MFPFRSVRQVDADPFGRRDDAAKGYDRVAVSIVVIQIGTHTTKRV